MLYSTDADFESAKRRVECLKEEENIEIILRFLEKLFAEGMSKTRVVKYANHLKVMSEKMKKSFLEINEDDITAFLSYLEQSSYAPHTKRDYRIVLKRLFTFMGRPELVKDVKQTIKGHKKKLPGEILTPEEVRAMIEVSDHLRNKAMISVLYEGGLRIGELTSLRLKDVEFDEWGAAVRVRGKTGERRVRIISSASLLANWVDTHPRRDNKEASLWVNLSSNYKKDDISYTGISKNLKRVAAEAGIEKRITPHIFRHSRATHLAKMLTEAEMNEYFGWVQGSGMPGTYVHLSGRDLDEKMLQIHGLKPKEHEKKGRMEPIVCPRCQYINAPVNRYCGRCGTPLDEKEALKIEMQQKHFAKVFPELALSDPQILEKLTRVVEFVELFEKEPELFTVMRSMVEKTKAP